MFLSGEFHGQRSLEGYSPWGRKESDVSEWLTLLLSLVTEQDPRCLSGTDPTSPHPHTISCSSSQKSLVNCIWCTLFYDVKTLIKRKKVTIWWSWTHSLQAYWSLRITNVHPAIPPSHFIINQSENCARADHTPCKPPSLTWPFGNAFLKLCREFRLSFLD